MLKILQKGIHVNAPLNKTGLSGDASADATLPAILALTAGKAATVLSTGVALANAASGHTFDGFIINDVAGYFFENKPALASGLIPLSFGKSLVVTDAIKTTETFAIGDLVYLGSGADAGLLTKTVPASGNTAPVGKAFSSASAAAPELTVLVY